MLALLSPAKKLLNFKKPYEGHLTEPLFKEKTANLVALMKTKSMSDIASLMHISKDLAELNYKRYQHFSSNPSLDETYPALFLFQGDVYQGLKAADWDKETLHFAKDHLAILSGLYGLLRPFDLIQPYRLEMGTKLQNPLGNNLYDYWQDTVARELNKHLSKSKNPMLINLASIEYFKAVPETLIQYPIVHIHFMEESKEGLKTIGIYAKKARGTMASYLMRNQIDNLKKIKEFNELNYRYSNEQSDDKHLVFIR
ncbi:MAG: peroxide stress protein YaaA [Proteobacteria bacterium]|nr:peroxide stress protein YaaA [Pseudomonadota bacterium]